ncbi:hypothetical protein FD755_016761, partial [Muntiacus reevesi]
MAVGVPCTLIASCSSTFSTDWLIQHILGIEDLTVDVTANDAVRFYPQTIDNKHYSADTNLTQKSGLDSVSSWLPLAEAQVVKHDFESVELSLEKLPEEYEFQEATGVKQIVQALIANVWYILSSLTGANHSTGSTENCHSEHPIYPSVRYRLSTKKPATKGMEYSSFQREDFKNTLGHVVRENRLEK